MHWIMWWCVFTCRENTHRHTVWRHADIGAGKQALQPGALETKGPYHARNDDPVFQGEHLVGFAVFCWQL